MSSQGAVQRVLRDELSMKIRHKIFLALVVVVLVAGGLFAGSLYIAAAKWRSPVAAEINILPGTPVRGIASQLAKERVICAPRLFALYARFTGVGDKLHAGTYNFPAGTTMVAALDKLVKGEVHQYVFTVIEGWTIKDIAKALAGQPFLASAETPTEFVKLCSDPSFIKELGFEKISSLEGYLFPDTYMVTRPLTAKTLIRQMVRRFNQVWKSLDRIKLVNIRLTPGEALILASIVEKEAGVPGERPIIASVFLNRLRKGLLLQSDPTIIYGLKDFDGDIRWRDKVNPHPYNTYVHAGLPPGPICNPGKASLEAVLQPAKTKYLYFVSKNNGTHHFSERHDDHLKAVRKYQIEGQRD